MDFISELSWAGVGEVPAKPRPWHAALEAALAESDFGLPADYELAWQPLPPFDDWIIQVKKDGNIAAVIVTAHQMSMSENLISLVNDNAAGRLVKVIATPIDRDFDASLADSLEKASIHLLRY